MVAAVILRTALAQTGTPMTSTGARRKEPTFLDDMGSGWHPRTSSLRRGRPFDAPHEPCWPDAPGSRPQDPAPFDIIEILKRWSHDPFIAHIQMSWQQALPCASGEAIAPSASRPSSLTRRKLHRRLVGFAFACGKIKYVSSIDSWWFHARSRRIPARVF
jgi:hypothetical protein